jgi:hypothetical protein
MDQLIQIAGAQAGFLLLEGVWAVVASMASFAAYLGQTAAVLDSIELRLALERRYWWLKTDQTCRPSSCSQYWPKSSH